MAVQYQALASGLIAQVREQLAQADVRRMVPQNGATAPEPATTEA
jgi:hypothetical protein